jgi:hypothetical protein
MAQVDPLLPFQDCGEGGAALLDGVTIDAPVHLRAEQILVRAQKVRKEVTQ